MWEAKINRDFEIPPHLCDETGKVPTMTEQIMENIKDQMSITIGKEVRKKAKFNIEFIGIGGFSERKFNVTTQVFLISPDEAERLYNIAQRLHPTYKNIILQMLGE